LEEEIGEESNHGSVRRRLSVCGANLGVGLGVQRDLKFGKRFGDEIWVLVFFRFWILLERI